MWPSRRAVLRPACSWRLSASTEIDKGGHQMPEIMTIQTPALGDRSYLIHDQTHAVVVDPQRDIDRVLAVAAAQQVLITHVLETHIHNDYVTGGLALARQAGATYVVAASEEVSFERLAVRDHDQILTGSLTVTAVHT